MPEKRDQINNPPLFGDQKFAEASKRLFNEKENDDLIDSKFGSLMDTKFKLEPDTKVKPSLFNSTVISADE